MRDTGHDWARRRVDDPSLERAAADQPMGQRHDQADDRPGALGCSRALELSRRRLRRLRGLRSAQTKDADASRVAAPALLITVVRDEQGDGHAVLTVKTDKGEFILDNQNEDVLLWSETGYRFVKRQSQDDPNVWV